VASAKSNRPYKSSSLPELIAVTKAKNVSEKIVKDVLAELECRTTAGARRLKRELLGTYPQLATKAVVRNSTPPAKRASRQSSIHPSDSNFPATIVYEENAVAYEFLRNTFTEEGEILARWGMTPTLPDAIMKKIFEMWKEHLSKNKDSMFRTLQQLESDQAKLQKTRTARNAKAGGK
jgi:hypothetical protein